MIKNNKLSELSRDDLEKKIFNLNNLVEIAVSLSSNFNFDSLIESILYSCMGQVIIDKIAIFIQTDIENNNLNIYMQRGYNTSENLIINEQSMLIKSLTKEKKILDGKSSKAVMEKNKLTAHIYKELKPELIIPLKSKNSLNGLIFISNKLISSEYTEEDIFFLDNLSKFASIAVENSRLYHMTTLDRMTGLYVHHYFQERLTEEIEKSKRKNEPLTLLMADLDHFKNINDQFGHQQGDIILKEIAKIIHQNTRGFDIASRYGGEEFAIILTDTKIEVAFQIGERLRKKIEEKKFKNNSTEIEITISIGIAQYNPKTDKNKKSLIEKADQALYKAKSMGRNTVFLDEEKSNDK